MGYKRVVIASQDRLAGARTLLFAPGDRPERLGKAWSSDADMVILDLEDAVAASAKWETREAVVAASADPTVRERTVVRTNAAAPSWHRDDLGALATIGGLGGVRARIVLESRYAGLPAPIDGVSLVLDDAELLPAAAVPSGRHDFGGKMCVHPRQVDPGNCAFTPDAAVIDWAMRVVTTGGVGGGAGSIDGTMIDRPRHRAGEADPRKSRRPL